LAVYQAASSRISCPTPCLWQRRDASTTAAVSTRRGAIKDALQRQARTSKAAIAQNDDLALGSSSSSDERQHRDDGKSTHRARLGAGKVDTCMLRTRPAQSTMMRVAAVALALFAGANAAYCGGKV
jgi:hypothetical protein